MKNIIDLKIKKNNCNFFLKKNGKYIYYPINIYDDFLCVLNNFKRISIIPFPLLIGKDEEQIIKKLLILNNLKKNNFQYVKVLNKSNENKDYYIYYFSEKNIDLCYFFLYLKKIIKDKEVYNYYYGSMIKKLITTFMYSKIIFPSFSNNRILIRIFYESYIPMIYEELYNKYNVRKTDFSNYHELYLFLRKHGYVNKFYDKYSKIILKDYKKYHNKIINDPNFEKFKNKKIKNIKNFSDLNILELVDKYVNKKFNKSYIKNKFIEIVEKYNI